MSKARYAIEFALFFSLFFLAYAAYQSSEEPTKFIYYNF